MKYTSPIGKFSAAALIAGFVLTFSTTVIVQAQPVPPDPGSGAPTGYNLYNANNNPGFSITNGNLVFSDFTAIEKSLTIGLSGTAIDTYNANGIEFQSGVWTVDPGTNYDLSISFIVSALNGSPITDVGAALQATPPTSPGRISVDETISTVGPGGSIGNSIGALALLAGGIQSTNVELNPSYSSLYIYKDFKMDNQTATSGTLNASDIIQTYVTPEPSTCAMLVSGLAGLGFMIRRRK